MADDDWPSDISSDFDSDFGDMDQVNKEVAARKDEARAAAAADAAPAGGDSGDAGVANHDHASSVTVSTVPGALGLGRAISDYAADADNLMSINEGDLIMILEKDDSGWWNGAVLDTPGMFPGTYVELVPVDQGPTYAFAQHDYTADGPGEISISANATLVVINQDDSGWWVGAVVKHNGYFPATYVEEVDSADAVPGGAVASAPVDTAADDTAAAEAEAEAARKAEEEAEAARKAEEEAEAARKAEEEAEATRKAAEEEAAAAREAEEEAEAARKAEEEAEAARKAEEDAEAARKAEEEAEAARQAEEAAALGAEEEAAAEAARKAEEEAAAARKAEEEAEAARKAEEEAEAARQAEAEAEAARQAEAEAEAARKAEEEAEAVRQAEEEAEAAKQAEEERLALERSQREAADRQAEEDVQEDPAITAFSDHEDDLARAQEEEQNLAAQLQSLDEPAKSPTPPPKSPTPPPKSPTPPPRSPTPEAIEEESIEQSAFVEESIDGLSDSDAPVLTRDDKADDAQKKEDVAAILAASDDEDELARAQREEEELAAQLAELEQAAEQPAIDYVREKEEEERKAKEERERRLQEEAKKAREDREAREKQEAEDAKAKEAERKRQEAEEAEEARKKKQQQQQQQQQAAAKKRQQEAAQRQREQKEQAAAKKKTQPAFTPTPAPQSRYQWKQPPEDRAALDYIRNLRLENASLEKRLFDSPYYYPSLQVKSSVRMVRRQYKEILRQKETNEKVINTQAAALEDLKIENPTVDKEVQRENDQVLADLRHEIADLRATAAADAATERQQQNRINNLQKRSDHMEALLKSDHADTMAQLKAEMEKCDARIAELMKTVQEQKKSNRQAAANYEKMIAHRNEENHEKEQELASLQIAVQQQDRERVIEEKTELYKARIKPLKERREREAEEKAFLEQQEKEEQERELRRREELHALRMAEKERQFQAKHGRFQRADGATTDETHPAVLDPQTGEGGHGDGTAEDIDPADDQGGKRRHRRGRGGRSRHREVEQSEDITDLDTSTPRQKPPRQQPIYHPEVEPAPTEPSPPKKSLIMRVTPSPPPASSKRGGNNPRHTSVRPSVETNGHVASNGHAGPDSPKDPSVPRHGSQRQRRHHDPSPPPPRRRGQPGNSQTENSPREQRLRDPADPQPRSSRRGHGDSGRGHRSSRRHGRGGESHNNPRELGEVSRHRKRDQQIEEDLRMLVPQEEAPAIYYPPSHTPRSHRSSGHRSDRRHHRGGGRQANTKVTIY